MKLPFIDRLHQPTTSTYQPFELTSEVLDDIPTAPAQGALAVRPYKNNEGIAKGVEFLESIHSTETSGVMGRWRVTNDSPAHAFEIRYAGDVINFQFVPGTAAHFDGFKRQLQDKYPDSQIERRPADLVRLHPGLWVAAATLTLRRYTLFPIKHVDLEGFARDPFGSITSEMVGTARDDEPATDVVVQVLFRPAMRDWIQGVNGGQSIDDIAYNLTQPKYERKRQVFTYETLEYPPSEQDKKAARIIRDQHGEKGWELDIRVLAVSADPEVAVRRCRKAAGMFRNYYESTTEQTFQPEPLGEGEVAELLPQAVGREFVDRGITKSQSETAGLVHVPNADINTPNVRWAVSKAGAGIPPGTPRFDFDARGVAGAPRERKQAAMLTSTDPTDPYWYGWGMKNGTEAGVRPETFNTHLFVGGQTGQGKTTLLKNQFLQIIKRGHGALFYDPKGRDALDFVSLVPEGREEDLIYIEIGGDRDRQVGFNFLEIPGVAADASDAVRGQAIEAMTDDIVALLSQAGGDDKYWGPRMDRVARHMIRGMARVGYQCTLLDMYLALLDSDGREQYARMVSDDRIEWIEDYANRQLVDMDDRDIEPLAGRLQQWVENDLTRELVSHPTSSLSVEDAVSDGRIIVVRDVSSSDTAGQMIATALLRRIWVAIREQTDSEHVPDPPPFFAMLDEFRDIATVASNIDQIYSQARAYNFSITAATQDLSGQLDDKILEAIEGQTGTFLSFNPGRYGDARLIAHQHSRDIDADDLLNLSKYRIYMRTHDDRDELTDSYKVRTFPPVDEVTDLARSAPETEGLVRQSLEQYGRPRRTSAEQKADSVFHDHPGDGEAPGADPEAVDPALVLKAVYDEAIVRDRDDGWVPADAVAPRLDRYIPMEIDFTSQLWAVLDRVPDTELARRENEGTMEVRCTPDGTTRIFATGASASAGAGRHRTILRDAYEPLLRLGLEVDLREQSGAADVDGVCRLRETLSADLEGLSLRGAEQLKENFRADHPVLAALSGGGDVTLEAESTTASKPAATCRNLAKAHDLGLKCVFLCRESTAETLWSTLTDPPYLASDGDHARLYNGGALVIDGERPVRPATARETVWMHDRDADDYVLMDSDESVLARFPSSETVFRDVDRYPSVESDHLDLSEWTAIPRPFIPDYEFETVPGPSAWEIVVVPEGASDPADLKAVVDGEVRPLADLTDGESTADVDAALSRFESVWRA